MADKFLCGKEYPPFAWVVERGKIGEMVQAIGDKNPVYDAEDHEVQPPMVSNGAMFHSHDVLVIFEFYPTI